MVAEQGWEEGRESFEDPAAKLVDCTLGLDAQSPVEGNDGEVFTDDAVTVGFEEFAGGFAGVETDVGAVHDAAVGVIEAAEQEAKADENIGDVGDGDDHGTARGAENGKDVAQQAVRLIEVFEDIENQYFVEILIADFGSDRAEPELKICLVVFAHGGGVDWGFQGVDADDFIAVIAKVLGEEAFAAANIEQALVAAGEAGGVVMTGVGRVLEGVVVEVFGKFGVGMSAVDAGTVAVDRFYDIFGVFDAVDVTNFVAVVGGNGDFVDAEALVLEFDNDCRVEVEIMGHFGEIDAAEGVQIVGAVARVEFGEVEIERAVFEEGEDLVSGVFVEGHAPLESAAEILHHAGAEDCVRIASDQGMVHVGQDFGGILAITVKEDDDVETALHEILVAENLIAAVALVFVVFEDLEFGVGVELFVAEREGEGIVLAGVVKDHDLFDVLPNGIGDAAEDLRESGGGVVGDDEDADALAVGVGKFGCGWRVLGGGVHGRIPFIIPFNEKA